MNNPEPTITDVLTAVTDLHSHVDTAVTDLHSHVDARFDKVDKDICEVREDIVQVRSDIAGMKTDIAFCERHHDDLQKALLRHFSDPNMHNQNAA